MYKCRILNFVSKCGLRLGLDEWVASARGGGWSAIALTLSAMARAVCKERENVCV